MANSLYNSIRETLLEGGLNWTEDAVNAILVDTSEYSVDLNADIYLLSIPNIARVGVPVTLSGKTSSGGAADANDVTFPSVSGASIEAVVLYKDTGDDGTSRLIAYIDTATGLPITPSAGDITVTWDNGANKIFRL